MRTEAVDYRIFFYLLWYITYILYPSWALPISTLGRFLVFSGLTIYFLISGFLLTRFLSAASKGLWIKTPLPKPTKQTWNDIRLIVICAIALGLHIYPLKFPVMILGDEPAHLLGGLGIYMFIDKGWQNIFGYPVQSISWIVGVTLLIMVIHPKGGRIFKDLLRRSSVTTASPFFIFITIPLLVAYFFLLRDLPYHQLLVRYPPVSKILYLLSYLLGGITPAGPRIIQTAFYITGAIYLYRIIILFRDRDVALLGASIYLFSPLVFYFASLAELACGVVFFIIIISFYFLRSLKNNSLRDIIITSLLLSTGFLYKRDIMLMIFICIAYLLYRKPEEARTYLPMLVLSIVPVVPWLIIGGFFSLRNYEFTPSHLASLDILSSYFLMIPLQSSWVIFIIFTASIFYFLFGKKDDLRLFLLLVFVSYYILYVADATVRIHRFSMAFYPTISVFIAIFIKDAALTIRWRHSFKFIFLVLLSYLITISTIHNVPPMEKTFVTYKDINSRYFPVDKAMEWVRDNVREGEKILILRVASSIFYRDKYGIDKDKIIDFWYDLSKFSTPEKLRLFCKENNISYIMFSYGEAYPVDKRAKIIEYLKENPEKDFTEITTYNMDDNYIHIYRINDLS
jgi:hypothetical protein